MLRVEIKGVVNHGEFLQTTATVTDGKVTEEVSYCHNDLPFTKDGVFNALMCAYNAPEVSPQQPPSPPAGMEPVGETKPYVPDKQRVAKVKALEDSYRVMGAKDKVQEYEKGVEVEL